MKRFAILFSSLLAACANQAQIDQAAAINVQLTTTAAELAKVVVGTGALDPQDAAAAVVATQAVAAGAKIIQKQYATPDQEVKQ